PHQISPGGPTCRLTNLTQILRIHPVKISSQFVTVGAIVTLMLGPALASGQNISDDSVSTCTSENCSSLRLPGLVQAFGVDAVPSWVDAFAAVGAGGGL